MIKYLITLLLIAQSACADGLIKKVFEAGDTLVSSTIDTTDACFIYENSVNETRPVRPTLYLNLTEIGDNNTHNWLQIAIDVSPTSITKAADGWYEVTTLLLEDYAGKVAETQRDWQIDLAPYIEPLTLQYFRLRMSYPYGTAIDSSEYTCTYEAVASDNMYTLHPSYVEDVTHYDLFATNAIRTTVASDCTQTIAFNTKLETNSGRFTKAEEIVLTVYSGMCEDDSLTVYVYPYWYGVVGRVACDTLTFGVAASSIMTQVLSPTPCTPDAILCRVFTYGKAAGDSNQFYMKATKIVNP